MLPRFSFSRKWSKALIQDGAGLSICFGLLSLLTLLAIWTITLTHVSNEKQQVVKNSAAQSHRMAVVAAANLNDRLGRALQYAAIGSQVLDGEPAAADYLSRMVGGDTAFVYAAVFDSSMRLHYRSSDAPDESQLAQGVMQDFGANIADMEQAQVGSVRFGMRSTDGLYVPMLVILRSPLSGARGIFVAELDLGRIIKDYQLVGDGYRVSIDSQDGQIQHAVAQTSTISAAALTTGAIGSSAYQELTAYPLGVRVTRDPSLMLTELAPARLEYVRYAVILSIAVISLTLVLIAISYHRKKLYKRLETSERDKIGLIDQLEQEKTRAYHLASHDYLTGIPNRMLFNELAVAALGRARRGNSLYALFFMDLNGFKPINDTLGHATGDMLLQAVAQRLRASLREYDLVARLGGDEFVVLLSDIEHQTQIAEIADKLVKVIGAPYPNIAGHVLGTSLSIGIALFPEDGDSVDELLSKADNAMYVAKKEGKKEGGGGFRFYDPGNAAQLECRQHSRIFLSV